MRPEAIRSIGPVVLAAVAAGAFLALWQAADIGEQLEINIGGCFQRCMIAINNKALCTAVCVLNPHAF